MKKIVLGSVAVVLFGQAAMVTAQGPASIDPGSISDSVKQSRPAPVSPPVKIDLDDSGNTRVGDQSPAAAVQVLLTDVTLTGATQPVPAEVTAVYKNLIGQRITFGAIQNMVADMQKAYRNAGQFLVQVILPPQEIDQENGVVQVRIVEGQIEKVVFQQPLSNAVEPQLQRYARAVEAEDPISYASVDRFLLLANDLPGMQASATLMPNPDMPGGSDLLMATQQARGSAFINANNYGSKYVGPNQLSLGASVYDLIGADALSVAVATNPNHSGELGYGSVDYGVVVGANATRIHAAATVAHTEPGSSLSAFGLKGKSEEYLLGVQQPLLVSTAHRLTLLASLSHLNSSNDLFDGQHLYKDTITPLMLGLAYQGILGHAYNDISVSVTKGLPLLGASDSLANPSVVDADSDSLRFNFESATVRYISAKTSVAFGTQLQFSRDRLVASERLSYGGAQFGQAYHFGVLSGDSGAFGSLALRYDLPAQDWLSQLQPEIFYDIGTLHVNDATIDESRKVNASSAGIGLNLMVFNHVRARVALAKPLNIDQAPDVDRGWRGFFNITAAF